jgi:hypothetical protein
MLRTTVENCKFEEYLKCCRKFTDGASSVNEVACLCVNEGLLIKHLKDRFFGGFFLVLPAAVLCSW